MTISIWRYSHLALAVSSFAFIFLASVTGIVLAFQPISEKLQPYKTDGFDQITLAESLEAFTSSYAEIITLEVDHNDFVLASVINAKGESIEGYFHPKTAEYLGPKIETAKFFQWTTNLHRSLFLKSTGRILVGLCSFLLFLIAVSGTILIIKRQRSFKKFFSKIVNDDFAQYWHVVLGRLSLLPIILITVTGVYLSMERFDLFPKAQPPHEIDYDALTASPQQPFQAMPIFANTNLSEVKSLEFPFSNDAEDFYTLHLKNKEVVVNQFNGSVISTVDYPLVTIFSNLSLTLHTGQGSILWSVILMVASVNILFFIYSGFAMTLRRRRGRLNNKFKKSNAEIVILVGSENGGTLVFANALQNELIAAGESVYITELNKYRKFKKAKHLIVMTATYGEGDPPSNATKFLKRLKLYKQNQRFSFSVVGFGSLAYPDFCKFAVDVDNALLQENAEQLLPTFTINDKSFESFAQWVQMWSEKVGLSLSIPHDTLISRPRRTKSFVVVSKTKAHDNPDDTFIITLKPKKHLPFRSGDLLAIYPKNDYRERLYSIGKVAGNIQLSVKYYENGLGSGYLNNLQVGDICQARHIENTHFHVPKKASEILIISNGTGIAPFLGMLDENHKKTETQLYYGLRNEKSLDLYKSHLENKLENKKLSALNLAYSRQHDCVYVQELLKRDGPNIAKTLENNGVIMICGSMAMYKDVMETLGIVCQECNKKPLSHYAKQIKSDCY